MCVCVCGSKHKSFLAGIFLVTAANTEVKIVCRSSVIYTYTLIKGIVQ